MPLFDVPLQCDMHTSYDFVFAGAWHPDISSFQADLEAHYDLTGTMQLYHDQDFNDGKSIIQLKIEKPNLKHLMARLLFQMEKSFMCNLSWRFRKSTLTRTLESTHASVHQVH